MTAIPCQKGKHARAILDEVCTAPSRELFLVAREISISLPQALVIDRSCRSADCSGA